MKKGGVVSTLVVMSILLIISVSFVSAGLFGDIMSKITGQVAENETEATNETEPEEAVCETDTTECWDGSYVSRDLDNNCEFNSCPSEPESEEVVCADKIEINFDKSNYVVGEQFEVVMEVFDSQGNLLPDYLFYVKMYDDRWHTSGQERTGADGYVKRAGTIEKPPGGVTKAIFNIYTEETSSCSKVEDTTEIEVESGPEPIQPEPEPKPGPESLSHEVEICAAKIKITLDKEIYYLGDYAELVTVILDSQGNPIPNYSFKFLVFTYSDGLWHTADEGKTDGEGYKRNKDKIEEGKQPIGKLKLKVYTEIYSNCNSVEDIVEVEIRKGGDTEEVCGIGVCVPDELEIVEDIPKDEMLYACSGCELESKCYPISYRKSGEYCTSNNEFISQMEKGACENNFECKSNVCISGECVGEGLMKKILNWFKKMFGGGDEEEKPEVDCSKLLIEESIGDYEYFKSGYGDSKESQVPLYSEDGEQRGTVRCCISGYLEQDGEAKGTAALVCPFDNREDIGNSLKWLSARGEITLGEYNEQKVYVTSNAKIWTHNDFILVTGIDPKLEVSFPEEIIDAYLKKYKNDLEDLEIPEVDIPYEPKPFVFCTEEDKKAAKECINNGGNMQSNPGALDGTEEGKKSCIDSKGYGEGCCEVYASCSAPTKYIDPIKSFLTKAEIVGELTLIDFEKTAAGVILQNGDRIDGDEWMSLGVLFEAPGEDYLQLFGPMYPFNPLDRLSLSPGLGPFEAGGDTHDDLNIIFIKPVKAAGIYLLDLGDTDERESITFLDTNNNIIKKISPWPKSTFGNPAPGTFVSLIYEEGISKIEILENTQDGDDIAYDNLYFVR